jgi:hypothetical protein
MLGAKLKMCSACHLEKDAMIEKTNRMLEDMLRNYVGQKQVSWEQYLFPLKPIHFMFFMVRNV